MTQNLGNATVYTGGTTHRPIPKADSTLIRGAHAPARPRPTGLDWSKHTAPDASPAPATKPAVARCKGCGNSTPILELRSKLCPVCAATAEQRFHAPLDSDLAALELTDPAVAAAAAALDEAADRVVHRDDYIRPPQENPCSTKTSTLTSIPPTSGPAATAGAPTTTPASTASTSPAGGPHPTSAAPASETWWANFRRISAARRDRWHGPDTVPWTGADWSNAMCGEAGEAANVVKKLRRHETGTATPRDPSTDQLLVALGDELADIVAYLDLLASHYGIDVEAAVARKFNAVSQREGFPERMPPPTPAAEPAPGVPENAGASDRPNSAADPTPQPRRTPRRTTSLAVPLDVDDLVRRYQAGQSAPDLARALKTTPKRIRAVLDDAGIPRRDDRTLKSGGRPREYDEHTVNQVRDLYVQQRLSRTEVARRLDLPLKTVVTIMGRHDIAARKGMSGARDGAKSLKQTMTDRGITSRQVKDWALTQGLISQIARGLPTASLVEGYLAAHLSTPTHQE